ncbi:MAG: phosphoribosylglycinamide formyltransferase [Cellvibrionaceae bacterium]
MNSSKQKSHDDKKTCRVVVLISGGGTNLQAIIDEQKNGNLPIEITAVISNRPNVKGLERATLAGIKAETIDHKNFSDRKTFDEALINIIDKHSPDLIVLAGFMRILTPEFVTHYLGKLINIHPSLLPKYPGLHTHQRAIDAGDKEHGVTVHFVTEELDGGPPILQAKVPILDSDTPDTLAQRLLIQEHVIYPLAVKWFAQEKLLLKNGKAYLKNELLPPSGHLIDSTAH